MEEPIRTRFANTLGLNPDCLSFQPLGGGSINQSFRILASGNPVAFFKTNSATKFPHLLACEAKALNLLNSSQIIKTPAVLDCFEHAANQYLLLQWIPTGNRSHTFWETFGKQLAALHTCTNETFGLNHNNYMGSIPQANTPSHSWTHFFQNHRLEPLLRQSRDKGILQPQHLARFNALFQLLPNIFEPAQPPSLLHGDLWSGNFMCNTHQDPVLFDPAVYFGHSSIDLAMTTLFGGFHQTFYDAYHHHRPLPSNFREQWNVCNLYPLLIHLLLFGSSYRPQIESILSQFA